MSSGRRRGHHDMTIETLQASTTIAAPAEAVFAVLADPASHPAIDGTGWVSKALDTAPLTRLRPAVPDGDVPRQPLRTAATR